jgi:hypothetical protein
MERISLSEVMLEGHIIEIKLARARSNTISGPRDSRTPPPKPSAEFLELLKSAEEANKKEREQYNFKY